MNLPRVTANSVCKEVIFSPKFYGKRQVMRERVYLFILVKGKKVMFTERNDDKCKKIENNNRKQS